MRQGALMPHRVLRFIAAAENYRAFFLEQWGLWKTLGSALVFLWGVAVVVAGYLEGLAIWALLLIAGAAVAAALLTGNAVMAVLVKLKQMQAISKANDIDRDALALELEEICRKVAALVGEFRGPLDEAWLSGTSSDDWRSAQVSRSRIVGQLVERYSHRYVADVWRLVRRASKVVPLDQADMWRLQHGARSEHDLTDIVMILAALADDVRTPKAPLPRTDRRMNELRSTPDGEAPPQLPKSAAAETPH